MSRRGQSVLSKDPRPGAPLLTITGLTKAFPGTLALDDVDFDLTRGEIHALLGQNGAGKSTLIKILAGVYEPTSGEILLDGAAVHPQVERLPVNFIHQDLGLVDAMSVAENIAIVAGFPRNAFGLIDWAGVQRAARNALATMANDIDPGADVRELSSADRSIVAIARALATQCDVLVLDEPTASLPEEDVNRLFAALRLLRARGLGIIYVSHRLDEVFQIADRVTILRDGRKIASTRIENTTPGQVVAMIVGRDLTAGRVLQPSSASATALTVEGLRSGKFGPVSFEIRRGEILALVGLRGAGHDVIARAIFGDRPIDSGRALLEGIQIRTKDIERAMAMGIGFISSKRAEESMAATLDVQENLFLNTSLTGTSPTDWLSPQSENRKAVDAIKRYSIRPPDPHRVIATFSGGNQQKVIVARWLEGTIKLLILEEPTTGVDVGSKAEIYGLLQESLSRGMAALLVSTDFEEIAKVAHRALVFRSGRVVAELDRADIDVSQLTNLAAGGDRAAAASGPA
ncbi:MAG: sugar ABC transporter ATP-binding protein [Bradyrhizobium sp.]|nr:MAG: sugar ABC transporter ATP-binding protein [Bradyrhizobium sp.]